MNAVDTGVSLLGEFILGGIAIGSALISWWAIRSLKQVQDSRVADQREFSDKLTAFTITFNQGQSETADALRKLGDVINHQARALDHIDASLAELKARNENLKQTVDSVVRDAVRGRRTFSMGRGMPAIIEGERK